MRLIIDVSEEAYGEIVSQVANGITNPLKICIANGTPIPDNATVCDKACFVSVGEKEPDEISEEVTLRFFRNTLKVRWQDLVIYNVEWLKKNWQMEMDIVCGVKPCDDAVSREDAIEAIASNDSTNGTVAVFTGKQVIAMLNKLPSVRLQEPKTGHWMGADGDNAICSCCNRLNHLYGEYCKHCGAKMFEPRESEE